MLDAVTLLFAVAVAIAFCGLLLVLMPATPGDGPALRRWGASLLTGALGLIVSAVGQGSGLPGAEPCGVGLFLLATSMAWLGARLFRGGTVRAWWALGTPVLWVVVIAATEPGDLRLAIACWLGAAMTVLAGAELWRNRTERTTSLPFLSGLMFVHAAVYASRGILAMTRDMPAQWRDRLMDGLVLESLLHALGVAFLVMATMKERTGLRAREELRMLALTDGLTGVANRRHFDLILAFEASRTRRARDHLGLVMIDVDQFKRYNDRLGHPQGDECLKAVAASLRRAAVCPGALVARYGGEEFAILLPSASATTTLQCAESARLAVERLAIPHPVGGVVTVSVGVAVMTATSAGAGLEGLLAEADRALYAAKLAGRNLVHTAEQAAPHLRAPVLAAA